MAHVFKCTSLRSYRFPSVSLVTSQDARLYFRWHVQVFLTSTKRNGGASQKKKSYVLHIFLLCTQWWSSSETCSFYSFFSFSHYVHDPYKHQTRAHTLLGYLREVVKIYWDLFNIDKTFHWNDELILARLRNFAEYRLAFTGYCMPFSPGFLRGRCICLHVGRHGSCIPWHQSCMCLHQIQVMAFESIIYRRSRQIIGQISR